MIILSFLLVKNLYMALVGLRFFMPFNLMIMSYSLMMSMM